jgi:hypothetical protein
MSTVRRRRDGVVVTLSPEERQVLAGLVTAVRTLLTPDDGGAAGETADPLAALVGMSDGPVEAPGDPVLRRLLPDAYSDGEMAAEFRQLTDADLRARKTAALDQVLADVSTGDKVVLDPDAGVAAWVQALNDVRLMLGTRLDITDDWADLLDELPPDDPRIPLYLFYDWCTHVQDALVTTVIAE